jgi:hypothetical protein
MGINWGAHFFAQLGGCVKGNPFIDINISTTDNFGRWFAVMTEAHDQMNIAAKNSEQHQLIHLYNEGEFVKDIRHHRQDW